MKKTPNLFKIVEKSPTYLIVLIIFLISFMSYSLLSVGYVQKIYPRGDEPHYLVATQSLINDYDLDLRNNYQSKDYRLYLPVDLTDMHISRESQRGGLYPIHYPGLSVVLIPFFAWFGRLGAVFFINLLASLTIVFTFLIIRSLLKNKLLPAVTSLVMGFTLPFGVYALQLFPAVPAAFLVTSSSYFFLKSKPSFFTVGILLALLPWFHFKYILLLAPFLTIAAYNKWIKRDKITTASSLFKLATPIIFSLVLLIVYSNIFYGTYLPVYSSVSKVGSYFNEFPYGIFGLFFDRKFGLLAYAPYYILVPTGIVLYRLKNLSGLILISLITISIILPHSLFRVWWGGWSPPGRYLVEVLPFFTIFIAVGLDSIKHNLFRFTYFFGSLFSVLLFTKAILEPGLLYNVKILMRNNYLWDSIGLSNRILPSLERHSSTDMLRSSGLIVVLAIFTLIFIRRYLKEEQFKK